MSTASESASKLTADELSLHRCERRYPKLVIGVAVLSLTMLVGAFFVEMNSQTDQGRWRSMICVTIGAIVLSGVAITFGRNRMCAVFRVPLTGLFAGMVTAVIVGGLAAAVERLATGSVPTASLRAVGLAGLPAATAIGVGIGLIGWAVFRLIPYRSPGNAAQGKRRRFQFGLWTLLFAVFVVALVLWITIPAQRNYQHQRAVRQLMDAGANIGFEVGETWNWLESVVGIPVDPRWYANVQQVELSWATDSDLQCVGQLTELRRLCLGNVDFTGDGLKHLAGLSQLDSLYISNSSVDDGVLADLARFSKLEVLELENVSLSGAGLSHLPHLPIRRLMLDRVNVTDADLEYLSACTAIDSLLLCGISVSDAGLAHLTQLRNLRFLHLRGTNVTGNGLACLSELPNLQHLSLQFSPIRDSDLSGIAELRQLRSLNLYRTMITDAGLLHLEAMSRLNSLEISGTSVTKAGAEQLRQMLLAKDIKSVVNGP